MAQVYHILTAVVLRPEEFVLNEQLLNTKTFIVPVQSKPTEDQLYDFVQYIMKDGRTRLPKSLSNIVTPGVRAWEAYVRQQCLIDLTRLGWQWEGLPAALFGHIHEDFLYTCQVCITNEAMTIENLEGRLRIIYDHFDDEIGQ